MLPLLGSVTPRGAGLGLCSMLWGLSSVTPLLPCQRRQSVREGCWGAARGGALGVLPGGWDGRGGLVPGPSVAPPPPPVCRHFLCGEVRGRGLGGSLQGAV